MSASGAEEVASPLEVTVKLAFCVSAHGNTKATSTSWLRATAPAVELRQGTQCQVSQGLAQAPEAGMAATGWQLPGPWVFGVLKVENTHPLFWREDQ